MYKIGQVAKAKRSDRRLTITKFRGMSGIDTPAYVWRFH
jgi:hypothetical protein